MPSKGKKKGKFDFLKVGYQANRDSVTVHSTSTFEDDNDVSIDPSVPQLTQGYHQRVVDIPDPVDENQSPRTRPATWSHRLDFIIHATGYSVGLGNLWRFPYKVYENGKGAFLLPYFLILALFGLPLFFLELVLGQYLSKGPIKAFGRMAPICEGLGYSMMALSSCMVIYYNVINFWSILYFFTSITMSSSTFLNGSYTDYSTAHRGEFYFQEKFLQLNGTEHSWGNFGAMRWEMVLCCMASWIIIGLVVAKSVNHSRYAVYFTCAYPFVCLLALSIIAMTKDGFWYHGLAKVFNSFEPAELGKAQVWKEASLQVFFSLGVGIGNLLNLARFNSFKNDCFRDAYLILLGDTFMSLLSAFVVFAFAGYLAKVDSVRCLDDLIAGGPKLTFEVLMSGMSKIGGDTSGVPQLMIALFSILLLTLGLDCVFATMDTLICALQDQFKDLREKRGYVTLGLCTFFFLLSLPYCAQGGIYLFLLMDDAVMANNVLIIAFVEIILVAWVFGINNFLGCAQEMGMIFSKAKQLYFKVSLKFICPLALVLLWFQNLFFRDGPGVTTYTFLSEDDVTDTDAYRNCSEITSKVHPNMIKVWKCTYSMKGMEFLHMLIQCFIVSFIFVVGGLRAFQHFRAGKPWKELFQATPKWKPADGNLRAKPKNRQSIFNKH